MEQFLKSVIHVVAEKEWLEPKSRPEYTLKILVTGTNSHRSVRQMLEASQNVHRLT
jgi:hypothetical protein